MNNLKALQTFTLQNIPTLDIVVLGALELFAHDGVPKVQLPKFKRPLIVGSVNAYVTGQIIGRHLKLDAVYGDEGNYTEKLKNIDGAILINASGKKHGVTISKELERRKVKTVLFTNNPKAPASAYVTNTHVFAKNREPYTYNTSTYMGMIMGATHEDPKKIMTYIKRFVAPLMKSVRKKKAYTFLVDPQFDLIRSLLYTKFDELFGGEVCGRAFTTEQVKHAKTVIKSRDEFFISFGSKNELYGYSANRLNIPMPSWAGPATAMAIMYYVMGFIQQKHPAYFSDNIVAYCKEASKIFGQELKPIVE